MEVDVLIVGAGPAGLSAANEFSKQGLKTLLVDKKAEIGAPKRCAEGLSMRWFKKANLEPDPKWAVQYVNGAYVVVPNGKKLLVYTKESGITGYILERKLFEKYLAERAIRNGTKTMLKTYVYDLIIENGFVAGAKAKSQGKELEIRAKLTIGADGIESRIGRMGGIKSGIPASEIDCGYQYEMVGVKLEDPHKMELYLGTNVAPRGYVWLFPKGEDIANVGIGVSGTAGGGQAKEYLDKFIKNHPEKFKDASITEINAGGVPVGNIIEKPVANGLVIIGDAAHMVNPIHGGGIGYSLEAGMLVSEVCSELVKQGKVSEKDLEVFAKRWMEVRGNEMKAILRVRQLFEKVTDEQINILGDAIDPNDLTALSHGKGLSKFVKILIKASPKAPSFLFSFLK